MNMKQPIYVKDFVFNRMCKIDYNKYGYHSNLPLESPGVYILKRKYYDIIMKYNAHDYRRWSRKIHDRDDPVLSIYNAIYETIQTVQEKSTSSTSQNIDDDDVQEAEEEEMIIEDEQGNEIENVDERAAFQQQKRVFIPPIKIQRIPFYGAYVHDAKPQLNVTNPVTVMDVTSLYPFAIVWTNLGPESRVRYSTIKPLIDKKLVVEDVDFIATHFSRSDDYPNSWRRHYEAGKHDYIEMTDTCVLLV